MDSTPNKSVLISSMASWARFPTDIRLQILEALLQEGCKVAKFATVSREWQSIIEKHNFARIKVTESRLDGFFSNTCRTRHLVNYIWLCLELEASPPCVSSLYFPADPFISKYDVRRVLRPIQALLTGLEDWEPTGELVLDISVHSPMDSEHVLKYLTFEPDIIPENSRSPGSASLSPQLDELMACMPRSLWRGAILRTLGTINIVGHEHKVEHPAGERNLRRLPEKMPTVPAVTGVLLRQQSRRQWHPSTLQRIFQCFPNLQEVSYEPWERINAKRQRIANEEYANLFKSLVLRKVRKLVIFENSNSFYKRLVPKLGQSSWSSRESLSMTLAANCHGLEELSASFLIEGASYFSHRVTGSEWCHLKSLTLTSQVLGPREHPSQIDLLLIRAAKAVIDMPALQTMELWNGRAGLAALFRYQRAYAAVIWRGTWDFALRPAVVQAWEDTSITHGARGLVVRTERLECGPDIKSHGDAIYHLGLSKPVVRPISLHQIRTEHNVHYAWEEVRRKRMRALKAQAGETDGEENDSEDSDDGETGMEGWFEGILEDEDPGNEEDSMPPLVAVDETAT